MAPDYGKFLDDAEQVLPSVPLQPCDLDKVLRLHEHDALRPRSAGNGHASATAELEQPFVAQEAQGAQNRVRVHPQNGREVMSRRQPFTGCRLSVGDGLSDVRSYLIMEQRGVGSVYSDVQHRAIHSSANG